MMDGSISTPSDRLQFMIDAATNGPWGLGRYTTQSVEGPDQRGICSTGGFNASWIDSEVLLLENEANAHNADRSVAKAIAAVTVGGA